MKKLLQWLVDHFMWSLSNHIMKRRYDLACELARRQIPLLLPRVSATLDAQRAEGGLSHAFSEFKLLELAELLWQFQPQTVLELGGGSTSAVMAEYAGCFLGVRVISVDEDFGYLAATRQRISPALRDNLSFVHCPRREDVDLAGVRTCYYDPAYYKMFPDRSVEFVYVDGPSADNGAGGKLPCVDAVRLKEAGWQVGHVVLDVRIATVRYCLASERFAGHRPYLHRNAHSQATEPWVIPGAAPQLVRPRPALWDEL